MPSLPLRVSAYLRWLGQWRPLWLALLACLLAAVAVLATAAYSPSATERAIRISGLALQLVAVVTAMLALRSVRLQFGRRHLATVLDDWWRQAPWRHHPAATSSINAQLDDLKFTGGSYSWSETDSTKAYDVRLAALEQKIMTQHALWDLDQKKFSARLQEIEETLQIESQSRISAIADTQSQVHRFALEGIPVAAAGLLCAFIGIVLSTASQEIACFLW